METLRTPDDRFADLPGFDFAPHYVEVDDGAGGRLRVHHLDEGPPDGEVVLLLHGEPSWSFLYRHMIPVLAGAGLRCVAPDLVGFGRSDKPAERSDYSYARHVEWMRAALLDELDLHDVTLVGQDWGGLIGLRVAAENPDRFARIVVANTGLPTGDRTPTDAFLAWQRFSQETEDFPVGGIVNGGCTTQLGPEVIAAYDAPFPDDSYKAGARSFPILVPTSPDDPAAARQPRRVGGAGAVGQAAAHRLLGRRRHHTGRRPPLREGRARRPGPGARHHRRRRPLPPGGPGPRARPCGRRPDRGHAPGPGAR